MVEVRAVRLTGATALGAAALVLGGCAGGGPTVCSTIGWSNGLRVEVDPGLAAATVRAYCTGCDAGPVPVADGAAVVHVGMSTPGSVEVTVLDAAGSVLLETETEPDWRRVGGSAECGGPSEATVVVSCPGAPPGRCRAPGCRSGGRRPGRGPASR
ncbi:hypothetical protein DQ241_15905 [Blastococcus sp. TF02A-30]|nr:hypothetical protein DQ241_15905 [Blastococcus sp. TF02A-30]